MYNSGSPFEKVFYCEFLSTATMQTAAGRRKPRAAGANKLEPLLSGLGDIRVPGMMMTTYQQVEAPLKVLGTVTSTFVCTLIAVWFLGMGTGMSTTQCVASSVPADHTCETPYNGELEGKFPVFDVPRLMAVTFGAYYVAIHLAGLLGLGSGDPVEILLRGVGRFFYDAPETPEGSPSYVVPFWHYLAASILSLGTVFLAVWFTQLGLGSNKAYSSDADSDDLGLGIGGPGLSYKAATGASSAVIFSFIMGTGLRFAAVLFLDYEGHMIRKSQNGVATRMGSLPRDFLSHHQRALSVGFINAAYVAVFGSLFGTGGVNWARDIVTMLFRATDTNINDPLNQWILFAGWSTLSHVAVGGLVCYGLLLVKRYHNEEPAGASVSLP